MEVKHLNQKGGSSDLPRVGYTNLEHLIYVKALFYMLPKKAMGSKKKSVFKYLKGYCVRGSLAFYFLPDP